MATQPTLLLVAAHAGGAAKTTLSKIKKLFWTYAGEEHVLFDGDAGNMALRVALQSSSTLGWGVTEALAEPFADQAGGRHILVDLGANALASKREIADFVPALQRVAADRGYRTIVVLPLGTNKVGSLAGLETLQTKLSEFQPVFIRVNIDGSDNYTGKLKSDRIADLGHLQPGFIEYIHENGLVSAIDTPEPEYTLAAQHVIWWLYDFARQPIIVDVFGSKPVEALKSLTAIPPRHYRFNVKRMEDAKDAALEVNLANSRIVGKIDRCGWSAAGLRAVASEIEQSR